ncbi:chromatin assembly and remodeling factor [Cordyceps fumosorosea ARSEF 2679]|uniref:Chromatin assembly and remodeling factor n=1 Tax=Cordyceps fumosorosea (strain ARSEF 2679) TaxID=1081104 RepID=A0A168B7X0_CORFA|nr:chromatin assembly and remodeling factor [Cordyceps fumosorosea ARSEF 2679]OAA69745.1 chromatin assembly and remodeling factor [Cordyceps fumosorosea ARSEF 2679]
MVLFKRKPVKFLPPQQIDDEDVEVWHIPQTGEIFADYDEYLDRMEFYKQPRFNDQITGHSGLTFFEAHESELAGAREVDESFPEALKGPILRRVQFQIVSRLDNLVDSLFDEFKQDYYPGEEVAIITGTGERTHGLVRDKTTFGERLLADGTRTKPSTRYLVDARGSEIELIVTEDSISRDRGAFTKAMLRAFLKKTVMREAWTGAPWLVKQDYAAQYHIDTRIPPHLRYDTKLQERKQLQAQKRSSEINGHAASQPARLPELKPAKTIKPKPPPGKGLKWPAGIVNGTSAEPTIKKEPSPQPPPPPKYPIEDLQLEPNPETNRPAIKFMCKDAPVDECSDDPLGEDVEMKSVGPLLETWDTLNVYCEIFKLDSFTFDDFVEAISMASERTPVQLFDEIHCSVLKILVDSEQDGGRVRIPLPEIEDDDSEDEDGEAEVGDEEEDEEEEEEEPDEKPVKRATRSSLAKQEAERIAAEAAAAEEETMKAEIESKTRAEEMMKEFNWVEHLRQRDFTNGGWERIVVGLLHQLSKGERNQQLYEDLLLRIIPHDTDPTQEAARQKYAELDINTRVQILQILCMLTMETKAVRAFMEDCNETMTKYRKDRVEWQRQRKQTVEDLRQLNEQRKILLPDNTPPEEEPKEPHENGDVSMNGADDTVTEKEGDEEADPSNDEKPHKKRHGRQVVDKRKKREEEEAARKAREKAQKEAAKASHQSKQFTKLLKEIQKKEDLIKKCEDEIATIENDLREADCPRTRVLGRDRFWNRYYWFERNGMPYGGLPTSSTAGAGYANGRLWIQGPDQMEREGYIDVPAHLENEYKAKFKMTIRERKNKEEGGTSMESSQQWGYIADAESLDKLIRWLDPRGFNELRLRKELLLFKDKIAEHMDKRQQYLTNSTEEEARKEDSTLKRSSSRIREKTPEPPSYRCLRWENSMALDELGHLHADPPPPPRLRKQTKKREAMEAPAAAPAQASKKRRR